MKTTLSYASPLTFAAAFFLAGCDLGQIGKGLDEPVQDATRSLERAIGELTRNSTQWQATLQTLESDLIAQGQRTLAN